MSPHAPRAALATHEVSNQPEPLGAFNAFADDRLLSRAVAAGLKEVAGPPADAQRSHLRTFGEAAGAPELRAAGRQADRNPPKLTAFDEGGRRIDEIEFHPAYHTLMEAGLTHGVSARAWTHPQGGHVTHSALMTLMNWADSGVCCPMSMTYAVVPALRASEWSDAAWTPKVTASSYDPRTLPAAAKSGATMGMAMTEKQGGSDVRANSTKAEKISGGADDEIILSGHKWFCSAPMCDAFLTLAYEDEGLSCFLAPRWTPDGKRNAIEIQRLKDKLGDRSNASSEIEYRNAWARRVGEPGRGVRTIIDMVHHTRLDCLVGSASGVRVALAHAMRWCEGRRVFQKSLIDQPLMRSVLADLSVEAIGAYALAFRVARSFDAAVEGDAAEAAFSRLATPIAKYWLCKRAPNAVYEAMECLGGVGFVEERELARLFRQSPLNAIWEGSGNVIALDILRAIEREPESVEAMIAELRKYEGADKSLDALRNWIEATARPGAITIGGARLFAERCALALTGAALLGWNESALSDAFFTLRVNQPSHTFGANGDKVEAEPLFKLARIAA